MQQEIQIIEKKTSAIVIDANNQMIVNQESYEKVANFLIGVRKLKKEIKDTFDPIVSKANATHKEATKQRKIHLDPVEKAEAIIKGKCKEYEDVMQQIEDDRIEKLRKEAEATAEAERLKLKEEEEKAVKEGDTEKAEELSKEAACVEEHLPVEAVPTFEQKKRVKGLGIQRPFMWKITDRKKIPREYWVVDEKRIFGEVRLLKNNTKIPGIEVYQD